MFLCTTAHVLLSLYKDAVECMDYESQSQYIHGLVDLAADELVMIFNESHSSEGKGNNN